MLSPLLNLTHLTSVIQLQAEPFGHLVVILCVYMGGRCLLWKLWPPPAAHLATGEKELL